jgi:hypothetical protein
MDVNFTPNNVNIYVTRLMDRLFEPREMAISWVEPSPTNIKPSLNIDRLNMIKGAKLFYYVKKSYNNMLFNLN